MASSIGWAVSELCTHEVPCDKVIGVRPFAHTLKPLENLLSPTTRALPNMIGSCLDALDFFPYEEFHCVYLMSSPKLITFAGLAIMNVSLLHSHAVIDQVIPSRVVLARAIARQIFFHYISPATVDDAYIVIGLSELFMGKYVETMLGRNELRYMHKMALKYISDEKFQEEPPLFNREMLHLSECDTKYIRMKSFLVFSMLERLVLRESFAEVLKGIVSECYTEGKYTVRHDEFLKKVNEKSASSGFDRFVQNWIHKRDLVHLHISFTYSYKPTRQIKLVITQYGALKIYDGLLEIGVQEEEKYHLHEITLDGEVTEASRPIHSKNQKNLRKNVMIHSGETFSVCLKEVNTESPIMWLRVDPDMKWLAHITVDQKYFNWSYQAKFDRHIALQLDGADMMGKLLNSEQLSVEEIKLVVETLENSINNEQLYYHIRERAANALAIRTNANTEKNNIAMERLRSAYERRHCVRTRFGFVSVKNDFSDFEEYFVQKAILSSLSLIRGMGGRVPNVLKKEIKIILTCIDQGDNVYCDSFFRQCAIVSFANTLHPVDKTYRTYAELTEDTTTLEDVEEAVELIVHFLSYDSIVPSFHKAVTMGALEALNVLSGFKYLDFPEDLFKTMLRLTEPLPLRKYSILSMLSHAKRVGNVEMFVKLLRCKDPVLKHATVRTITKSAEMIALLKSSPLLGKAVDLMKKWALSPKVPRNQRICGYRLLEKLELMGKKKTNKLTLSLNTKSAKAKSMASSSSRASTKKPKLSRNGGVGTSAMTATVPEQKRQTPRQKGTSLSSKTIEPFSDPPTPKLKIKMSLPTSTKPSSSPANGTIASSTSVLSSTPKPAPIPRPRLLSSPEKTSASKTGSNSPLFSSSLSPPSSHTDDLANVPISELAGHYQPELSSSSTLSTKKKKAKKLPSKTADNACDESIVVPLISPLIGKSSFFNDSDNDKRGSDERAGDNGSPPRKSAKVMPLVIDNEEEKKEEKELHTHGESVPNKVPIKNIKKEEGSSVDIQAYNAKESVKVSSQITSKETSCKTKEKMKDMKMEEQEEKEEEEEGIVRELSRTTSVSTIGATKIKFSFSTPLAPLAPLTESSKKKHKKKKHKKKKNKRRDSDGADDAPF
eukprot:m.213683 g.213683  ORF g.213683 m.213683 type:complete len:1116 (+) comp13792_c0_seq21:641-3988(+)